MVDLWMGLDKGDEIKESVTDSIGETMQWLCDCVHCFLPDWWLVIQTVEACEEERLQHKCYYAEADCGMLQINFKYLLGKGNFYSSTQIYCYKYIKYIEEYTFYISGSVL